MTSLLLMTLASHALLIAVGLSFMQMASRSRRLPVFACLPFAWGLGGAFVYAIAKALLNGGPLNHWHGLTSLACLAVVAAGAYCYLRADPGAPRLTSAQDKLSPIHFVLGFLILSKLLIVVGIAAMYPVYDSDATIPYSYTSLAKYIILGQFDALDHTPGGFSASHHVPLLNAWLGGFWDRWHDSLAALSWVFYYLFIVYAALVVCMLISRHATTSLLCAYFFSVLPALIHHVVRPGFHDLPTAYFFMLGVSAILLYFFNGKETWSRAVAPMLLFAAVVFLPTIKLEGIMWSVWLLLVALSFHLVQTRLISWQRLLAVQLSLLAGAYAVYWLSADFILHSLDLSARLKNLFVIKAMDPNAVSMFVNGVFFDSMFSVWWWAVLAFLVALIARGRLMSRLACFYVLILLLAIFYYANFTGNVQFTLIGSNVARFFIQIHAVMLIVYLLSVLQFKRMLEKRTAAEKASGSA